MNYLILSIIENIGPEAFWNILGRKSSQLFGRECAGSTIWMIFSLCLRSLITTLKLDQLLPNGIIFALPIFFQVAIILENIYYCRLFRQYFLS